MFCHPAWAVGSYGSSPPATRADSTGAGGFFPFRCVALYQRRTATVQLGKRREGARGHHPSAVFNLDDTAFESVGRSKDAIEKSSDGRGGIRRLPLSLQRKHKPVGVGAHPFSRSLPCLSVN